MTPHQATSPPSSPLTHSLTPSFFPFFSPKYALQEKPIPLLIHVGIYPTPMPRERKSDGIALKYALDHLSFGFDQ